MFQLYDNFISSDENMQPYSFTVERHTHVENLHTKVCDGCFHMGSIGNRYLLNTPEFFTGRLTFDFKMNCLEGHDPKFILFFQYDQKKRRGKGIRIYYDLAGKLRVALVEDIGNRVVPVLELVADDFRIEEEKSYSLELVIGEHSVSCSVGKERFVFACEQERGLLALERYHFLGELILEKLCFVSEDTFDICSILPPVTMEIPLVNGGDIPYKVTWQLDKIGSRYFLQGTLDGGTKSRKLNKADRPGQYSVEIDRMTSPYIGIRYGSKEKIFNLANGENCFVDPNIAWQCQKGFFGDVELPMHRWFAVSGDMFGENLIDACQVNCMQGLELIFGYEYLECKGYRSQNGGHEFRFNPSGELLYSGAALDGKDIYEVQSPFDKFAMSLIPKDCYHREEVEEHIKYNHYFETKEDIQFTLVMKTTIETAYIDVVAAIWNVYETEKLAEEKTVITVDQISELGTKKASGEVHKGYRNIRAKVKFNSLDTGVYKIVFNVYYGEKLYKRVMNSFEVFNKDTDENPVLKSGLPFVFSMPNEQKWLMRNAFDVWNPMHSCDTVHYIACATDTPIEAETRKTWELLKGFKRKWFAWLGDRTCKDYLDERHLETVKHADYLFYSQPEAVDCTGSQRVLFPFRADHWYYTTTKSKFQLNHLRDFLTQNPEAAKVVDWDMESDFTYEHYESLMKNFRDEWILYENNQILDILKKQNIELESINPGVKRSIYGPFSLYVSPTLSYRTLPAYGLPIGREFNEEYNGFAVFEDYPFSCAYHTYRGPFALMSILLHCPEAVIYPEQYAGGWGGCIDGAVKYAHAPMGEYKIEPYQNATHAFEYVFNTPYKLPDGYHYWNTYGFHRASTSIQAMNVLVREWKYVVANKPQKPMKSMAYIAEYDESDTVFDVVTNDNGYRLYTFNNQSELASGFIHECSREGGLPNGFALKFDTLSSLSADECDVIVVPSLKNADKKYISELRRLYNQGVNLIAVSDVTGLEDLFGVEEKVTVATVNSLTYQGETEDIYEAEASFQYQACGAQVLLWAENDMPAILCTERTALINTSILNLGCEKKEQRENKPVSYYVIGRLIKEALKDVLKKLSSPLAEGENVGVTLFHTEDGRKLLMAINYTPFDNIEHGVKQAVIRFRMERLTNVSSARELFVGKQNGIVKEIRFDMKPYESVFVELQ